MKVFTELKMIEVLDDSTIYMAEVGKMLGSESWSKERTQKYRAKLKASQMPHVTVSQNVTNVTCDEEIDIEIEKEIELEIDIESIVADKKPKKTKYAEFVSMLESEYQTLISKHGETDTARVIEILNYYKGSSGKKYKSDYCAINNWVLDRLKQEKAKEPSGYLETLQKIYNEYEVEK